MYKKFLVITFCFTLFIGFFAINKLQAMENINGVMGNGLVCEANGGSAGCVYTVSLADDPSPPSDPNGYQAYRIEVRGWADGNGAFGPAGGKYGIDMCISPSGMMWTGACWNVVDPNSAGNIGDGTQQFDSSRDIGTDDTANLSYGVVSFYVNDAKIFPFTLTVFGRQVSVDSFTQSATSIDTSQTVSFSWSMTDVTRGSSLNYSGPITCDAGPSPANVGANSSTTCTPTGPGTATFTLQATGYAGRGDASRPKTITSAPLSVDITSVVVQNSAKYRCSGGGTCIRDDVYGNTTDPTCGGAGACTLPENGVCATPPNSGTYSSTPSGPYCTSGISSALSGSGPWSWTCSGINGGTNASCSANKTSVGGPSIVMKGWGPPSFPNSSSLTTGSLNITSGATGGLVWNGSNVSNCKIYRADGSLAGSFPKDGSAAVGPVVTNQAHTIICDADNGSGQVQSSFAHNVAGTPSVTLKGWGPPSFPNSSSLTTGSLNITYGGMGGLVWTKSNVDYCEIYRDSTDLGSDTQWPSQQAGVGPVTQSVTHTIICNASDGSGYVASTFTHNTAGPSTVKIQGWGPPSNTVTDGPVDIQKGSTGAVTWTSTNAVYCELYQDGVFTGHTELSPSSVGVGPINSPTAYQVNCTNGTDISSDIIVFNPIGSASVTLKGWAPPVSQSSPVLNSLDTTNGASGGLVWTSQNVNYCEIYRGGTNLGSYPLNGNALVGPLSSTQTHTIICNATDGSGYVTSNFTHNVAALLPPTITFTGSPTTVAWGGSSVLTWNVNGADSCTAGGSWNGSKNPASGNESTGALAVTQTYTLTCTGQGGTTIATPVIISVSGSPVDLTAGAVSPTTAVMGTPVTFTGSVTNVGGSGTGASFFNFFQLSDSAGGAGPYSEISINSKPALASGASASVTSSSKTFSAPGDYSVRLCADSDRNFSGTIDESNENNNCGPWIDVTVTGVPPTITFTGSPTTVTSGGSSVLTWTTGGTVDSCTAGGGWNGPKNQFGGNQTISNITTSQTFTLSCSGPGGTTIATPVTITVVGSPVDLTADVITPTSLTTNSPTTFTTTVTNIGGTGTGAGFNTFFQLSDTPGGSGPYSAISVNAKPALGPSSSVSVTSSSKTFPVPGTHSVRACADNDASFNDAITEADEGNNCGAWTDITVSNGASAPVITFSGNPTTVASGGSTTLLWTVSGADTCTAGGNWSGSKNPNGATQTMTNITTDQTYTLSCTGNGLTTVATPVVVTVSASVSSVNVTANPTTVTSGGSTLITWTTSGTDSCTAAGGWSGLKNPNGGNETISNITTSKTFTLNCTGPGGPSTDSASVTVTGSPVDLTAGAVTPATATVGSGVTFTGTVTNIGGTGTGVGFNNYFQLSDTPNGAGPYSAISVNAKPALGPSSSVSVNSSSKTFSAPGTYSVRLCADNDATFTDSITESDEGNNCGAWVDVDVSVVSGAVPTVGSPTDTAVTSSGATIGATVLSLGLPAAITARGTCFGLTPSPSTNCVDASLSQTVPGAFSRVLTGLVPSTTYYYRGYATNGSGTGYSSDGSFTTSGGAQDGICGSKANGPGANSRVYPIGQTDWSGGDTYCTIGSPTLSPAFPTPPSTVTWQCNGIFGGGPSPICSATSQVATYAVNVTVTTVGGSVSSMPAGIDNCTSLCTKSFTDGTVVTLVAKPSSSYWKFSSWGGDCSGSGSCVLTVTSSKTVTATFVPRLLKYIEF